MYFFFCFPICFNVELRALLSLQSTSDSAENDEPALKFRKYVADKASYVCKMCRTLFSSEQEMVLHEMQDDSCAL